MNQLYSALIVLISYLTLSNTFNISPVPNYVFKEPELLTGFPKYGSSLFGFQLTLRQSSIIIGAPKAQSNLPAQNRVNETGVIYKCKFTDSSCNVLVFDENGNQKGNSINSQLKDNQLLGFSMDGLGRDDQKMVVCAPHVKTSLIHSGQMDYLMHGTCYWTENVEDPNLSDNKNIITAFKDINLQTNEGSYYYYLGEMGFSTHINDDNDEILLGAPGVNNWRGSIVHVKQQKQEQVSGGTGEVGPGFVSDRLTEVISNVIQHDDSYMGYAVASGYFLRNPRTLFYVASAPQADQQSGRVYIFSINKDKQMVLHKKFSSLKMGEYFGYSLLVEDFNNDNLPDIAISAPMYSKSGFEDNGAVYIYRNLDHFSFTEPERITSDRDVAGRFGTALGRLGDINLDGYNDLAIGAPFEDDGAVYIYLGSAEGLNTRKYSQKLVPEKRQVTSNNFMFGHSITRGVDIDQNKYNDVAIGAPGGEKAFLYRTYPVGKIEATLTVAKKELQETDRKLKVTGCWWISSVTSVQKDLGMTLTLKADFLNNRAKWQSNNNKIYETNVTVNSQRKCMEFDLLIDYNPGLVFRPIDIEMEYKVHEQAVDTANFCTTCVKIDSNEVNSKKETIIYSTGCAGTVCVADLSVKGEIMYLTPPFILGSQNSLTIEYIVKNRGEPAYLPQIRITIDNNVASFARIPSSCKLMDSNERELVCDLTQGNPIKTNDVQKLKVSIDTSKLEGNDFSVSAAVTSSGAESSETDNKITTHIALDELSHVEITGKSNLESFALENIEETEIRITHTYQIVNNGPSTVRDMSVDIFVPSKYLEKDKKNPIQIVDVAAISIAGSYNGQYLQWTKFSDALPAIANKVRSKRDAKPNRSRVSLDELPPERTIFFTCDNEGYESNLCVNTITNVKNFRRGNEPIEVTLNFTLKVEVFDKVFTETQDIFKLQTFAKVKKPLHERPETLQVEAHQASVVIFKYVPASTPIWIIIVSILAGIILLAILSYVLYKMGFFKRNRPADKMNLRSPDEMELKGTNSDDDDP